LLPRRAGVRKARVSPAGLTSLSPGNSAGTGRNKLSRPKSNNPKLKLARLGVAKGEAGPSLGVSALAARSRPPLCVEAENLGWLSLLPELVYRPSVAVLESTTRCLYIWRELARY